MAKVEILDNFVYETPSNAVLHSRKVFHVCHKEQAESIEDWFLRIQTAVVGCEFGYLNDFMLIDKFISGFNDDLFDKIAQTTTLAIEQLLSIATSNENFFNRNIDHQFEPIDDTNENEILTLETIKWENIDEEVLRVRFTHTELSWFFQNSL